ncbi:unnamed protein product [Staurois parvus]|uniref:Uncharacterized protein n=1 Tax=Staurois parvus TaxID=386267 RepID=A0ABN9H3Z2_9NEOB|nr:unnamed protein product [Staurois parvus]
MVSGLYYGYKQQLTYTHVVSLRSSGAGEIILGCPLVVGYGSSKKYTDTFKKIIFLLFWDSFPLVMKKKNKSITIYHQMNLS